MKGPSKKINPPRNTGYRYSDVEKAEAIIRLAVNHYAFQKTADELGIPVQTIRRWNKSIPKKGVFDLLNRAIERMLMVIPTEWKGNEWAIALGILIDKYQLMQGEPTTRSENIFHNLQELTDDERKAVVDEAQRIIEGISNAGSGGVAGG